MEFIRNPDLFQFDMLDSPAVQQLKGDSKFGGVYQLLTLLLTGDMKVGLLARAWGFKPSRIGF